MCDTRTLARTNTTITRLPRSLTLFLAAAAAVRDERGVYITYKCDERVCVRTRVPNVFLRYRKQFISCTTKRNTAFIKIIRFARARVVGGGAGKQNRSIRLYRCSIRVITCRPPIDTEPPRDFARKKDSSYVNPREKKRPPLHAERLSAIKNNVD